MKNTKMNVPFVELTKEQQAFVRELAEEEAGHALTDGGVQFWMDLELERSKS